MPWTRQIADYDTIISWNILPSSMSSQRCAEDLIAKSWKIADMYDEGTSIDAFIKGIDASIRRKRCNYWAFSLPVNVTEIAFQA